MFCLTSHARPAALAALLTSIALAACGDDGTQSNSTTGDTTSTETESDTGSTDGETTAGPDTTGGTTGDTTTGPGTTEEPSTTSSTSSGSTDATTMAMDLCGNGLLDGDETDVDCGGDTCSPCALAQSCEIFSDCESQACVGKLCIDPECLEDQDCDGLDDACSQGVCLPNFTCSAYPANEGATCESTDLCVLDATCQSGACTVNKTVDCTFLDGACKTGFCDPQDGLCYNELSEDGTACDDLNACTSEEVCLGGACINTGGPGYVFFEDFAAPAPGWDLDDLWEIGPAIASPPDMAFSGEDPGEDHTPTDDNALAGVVIGGLNTIAFHGDYCLSSPEIDLSGEPGEAFLSFWRHLHSDSSPLTVNTIVAFDGNSWIELETGYDSIINDAEWKRISFDVTALKNADFQFKICTRRLPGSADMASWSVDDVTVAATDCTP